MGGLEPQILISTLVRRALNASTIAIRVATGPQGCTQLANLNIDRLGELSRWRFTISLFRGIGSGSFLNNRRRRYVHHFAGTSVV